MNIGRNDPCPCGSGKKYNKCCLGRQDSQAGHDAMESLKAEIGRELADGQFSSLEEAQAVLDTFVQQKNAAPFAAFHGLAPEQMHRFLHFPFDSPDLVRFAEDFATPPEAPILTLFALLAEAIGEKGLKPTAKGNLPQRFCREAALSFWGKEKYEDRTRRGSIRSEMDFFDMHCLRLVAGLAGLVRKYKGKFVLSVKCRKKIASQGIGAVYPDLFTAYVTKFNWGYRDGYQEIFFLQQAFLFTLFLLSQYGGTSSPQEFYEDIFLGAFPDLLREIDETPYQTVEETVRRAYFYRSFMHFAEFFGLAELQAIGEEKFPRQYEVKKSPLLDQFVSFIV
ncbi:MAG: SEC-C metal-binding domain-containing protein [Thermodesulfobacteriota bacterium]|nr:SEC-C metal-binding domain-containing protein [Thermodesulfobacteriota bacterium]